MADSLRLIKYKCISGTLTCRTGMRIGGSKDDIEVGGNDNPILRDPVSHLPYIPGSSLKGKLRSLLEYLEGKVGPDGSPHGCDQPGCLVCTVFGPHLKKDHRLGPTRIIVRDAPLSEESKQKLEPLQAEGIAFAEVKRENMINRMTGKAVVPRPQERVPAGTKFDFTIHVRIFEGDSEAKIIGFLERGLKALQNDYLGGSGTRGYGWVALDYKISDCP